MSRELKVKPKDNQAPRLTRCLNYTRQMNKRVIQINNSSNREMSNRLSMLQKNFEYDHINREKLVVKYKDNVHRMQAMLRVFNDITTMQLLERIKGADFEGGIKKIVKQEVDKEINQNDPSSVSQRHQQKVFNHEYDQMLHTITRLRRFDTKLVKTPMPYDLIKMNSLPKYDLFQLNKAVTLPPIQGRDNLPVGFGSKHSVSFVNDK